MNTLRKQSGITLMEMTVVVAIVALLAVFGLPAIRAFVNSLESKGPTEAMINAALSSARAIALKEQRYAGIRFQKAYDPKGPLGAAQYMIFIIYEPPRSGITLTTMFRVIEGCEPIKLPETVGIFDGMIRTNNGTSESAARCENANERELVENDFDDSILERTVTDTSAFSILFSPSGKLVIHDVRVRDRDGDYQPDNGGSKVSMDDVFNSLVNIRDYVVGMFVQDDYADLGLGGEKSRCKLKLYDCEKFRGLTNKTQRWNYLNGLEFICVNAYTGEIIRKF